MAKQQTKAQLEKELKSLQGLHEEAHDERVRLRRELKDALGELDGAKRQLTTVNIQLRERCVTLGERDDQKAALESRVLELEKTIEHKNANEAELIGQVKALSAVLEQIRSSLDLE